ncbi:MAG: hypothetical protein ABWY36_03260 [Leifsonia sp.]
MTLYSVGPEWEPGTRRPRWGRRILVWLVVAGIGCAAAFVIINPVRITDQITVWTHEPSAQAVDFANRSTMTDDARFLFYASVPRVEGRDDFNAECSDVSDDGVTLGCYVPLNRTIHLFDIVDPRLDGMQVVTAAHEMLHARWARMSTGDRDAITPLLEAEAKRLASDTTFTAQMALYDGIGAAERVNELHSILGTEFTGLAPALEAHYHESFRDRAALVALHARTDGVFTTLQAQGAALVAELDGLRASIDADSDAYSAGSAALDDDVRAFNDRWASGTAGTRNQYDDERSALVDRESTLDALYDSITARRAEFEAKADELEAMNLQVEDLNAAIDSHAVPPVTP